MPDLEEKIAEWRRRMAAGGIKAPAVLDELENHLREDMQRQVSTGTDEEKAFEAAAQRIGKSDLLKAEFAKVSQTKEARAGKVMGIACCLIALPLSALAVPTFLMIPELSFGERVLGSAAVVLTFLSIASWQFSHRFLPVIRNRRIRMATTISLGVFGLTWLYIFAEILPTVIVPHIFSGLNIGRDEFRPVFAMGIAVLWAMALTAVLGGIAYGLEEAARRRTEESAHV
jgi:cation transport ATPase